MWTGGSSMMMIVFESNLDSSIWHTLHWKNMVGDTLTTNRSSLFDE
jgi:hypothetical protein